MLGLSWRVLRESAAIAQGLRIKIYEEWQPDLDEFLKNLPEQDIFPHELCRLLMKSPSPGGRQIIRVTERGEPVALACVKKRWGYWVPVTHEIVPGVLFPVKEGYLHRVLPALGLPLHVEWWRWPEPPRMGRWIQHVESCTDYSMKCSEDFEAHWRKTSLIRHIKAATKRCCGFEFNVNAENSTEWILKSWNQKWHCSRGEDVPDLGDKLMAAQYLQKKGLHYSVLLIDRDEPVAGLTFIIHRNEAVGHISYRNPEYDRCGVLNRLWEVCFWWARDMGFDGICLGPKHEYKKRWAPERGQHMTFTVYPDILLVGDRVAKLIGAVRRDW